MMGPLRAASACAAAPGVLGAASIAPRRRPGPRLDDSTPRRLAAPSARDLSRERGRGRQRAGQRPGRRSPLRAGSGDRPNSRGAVYNHPTDGSSHLSEQIAGDALALPADEHAKDDEVPAQDPRSREQLWKAAVKLPMYSVAVIPLMVWLRRRLGQLVGAAAAFAETGLFLPGQFLGILVASLLIIAWLNLSNDAFDSDTDVDKSKPESVVNLLGGNKRLVLVLANAALVAGVALMAVSTSAVADIRVVHWLAAAVACGYMYQGPPFRLSYKGLGEPLCFLAFGPLATGAFYLAHRGAESLGMPITPVLWILSVIVGITTTAILFCSHFHQIKGDLAAGKMSPLVRLGTAAGARVIGGAAAAPYMLLAITTAMGIMPWPVLIASSMSLPASTELADYANENHSLPAVIMYSKLYAIKWHCALGIALVAGLLATALIPGLPGLPGAEVPRLPYHVPWR